MLFPSRNIVIQICFGLFGLVMFCACGVQGGHEAGEENRSADTAYHPKLVFPADLQHLSPPAKSLAGIDCLNSGISEIEFRFSLNEREHSRFTFACDLHEALISGVPSGNDIQVDVYAFDRNDSAILHGAETTDLHPNQVNQGGEIVMQPVNGEDTDTETDIETVTNELDMTFNLIPGGTFTMGSPVGEPGRESDEAEHQVTLSPFYMQATEVTQGQWKALMGEDNNPSVFHRCGDSCPVDQVSWNDVQQFIDTLNNRGIDVYRLPTEAEWEFAARGGRKSAFANGRITETGCTPVDETLDAIGWYCGNSEVDYDGCRPTSGDITCGGTHPVGSIGVNNYELADMHGNVWEWCQDRYGQYASDQPIGHERVLRGGSWFSPASECRSAARFGVDPSVAYYLYGFRLVCESCIPQ